MAFLSNKNGEKTTLRETYVSKFSSARSNLLFMIVMTAVNLILLLTNSGTYFLFSAYVPYMFVFIGMLFCGMMSEDYYIGLEEIFAEGFFDNSLFVVTVVISIVVMTLYFLAWLFSKKNRAGWLIFALVMFVIDTAIMILSSELAIDSIIDIAIHIWVIYYLVSGISANSKLKKLPPEEEINEETENEADGISDPSQEQKDPSSILRHADKNVKHRVLLEAEACGLNICYRRVGKVNELVIGNYVYDEYEAVMEFPHTLKATVDGHTVEAGLGNPSFSFIKVDGEMIKKKIRIV